LRTPLVEMDTGAGQIRDRHGTQPIMALPKRQELLGLRLHGRDVDEPGQQQGTSFVQADQLRVRHARRARREPLGQHLLGALECASIPEGEGEPAARACDTGRVS
jgi:hypothetical protein